MTRKQTTFGAVFLGGVALDQATKWAVYLGLEYRTDEVVLIPGLLSIVHAQNPGAAFGMMNDVWWRYWLFGAFTVIALAIVAVLYRRLEDRDTTTLVALGMVASGIVGNAIDRLHKRTVTDFIRVFVDAEGPREALRDAFGTSEWPTFNVADAALFVGAALFLVGVMFGADDDADALAEPPADEGHTG